ncbi:MAG: hypothetical protein V2I33_17230 [Kangiellaceae bacterium]|nr:hypothetical protein [Kangiellaceae bacterium]
MEIEIDLVDVFSVGMQGVMKIRLRVVESWVDPRLDSIDHEDEEFRMKANANALWHPDGRVQHNVDTKT